MNEKEKTPFEIFPVFFSGMCKLPKLTDEENFLVHFCSIGDIIKNVEKKQIVEEPT